MRPEEFKKMLVQNGSSYNKLAEKLGVTKATICRKTHRDQFYISELRQIKDMFDLSDEEFLNMFFK